MRFRNFFSAALVVCLAPAVTAFSQGSASRKLINEVTLSKDTLCRGEILEVNVSARQPDKPGTRVDVAVNELVGNKAYLQFFGPPGKRFVYVTASTENGVMDGASRQVTIRQCSDFRFLEVASRPNPYHNMRVDFTVANHKSLGVQQPTYEWDFGDGSRARTSVPYSSHDYAKSMDFQRPFTWWHVTVTEVSSRSLAKKTVAIPSMYYYGKQRGVLRPPTETNQRLERHGQRLTGEYLIRNLEKEAITFDTAKVEYQPCNPSLRARFTNTSARALILPKGGSSRILPSVAPRPGAPLGGTFSIGPLQELNGFVNVEASSVPSDACGMAYHFIGRTASGLKAYASLYFEVKDNPETRQVVRDKRMLDFLRDLVRVGLVKDAAEVTQEDLYRWQQEGKIRRTKDNWWEVVR